VARLKLVATVKAEPEEVFRYVTAWGPDGPTDAAAFRKKYGAVQEASGNTLVAHEEGEDGIAWRCTFEYPTRRVMEAVASRWADRTDTFQEVAEGTRWSITWRIKARGLAALLQWLYFQLRKRKQMRAELVEPVAQHFAEG
jgi:hypothetical protein